MMMFPGVQPRAHPQKYLERNRKVSVGRVEYGWLRVDRYIRAESQLPCAILYQIARASKSVGAYAVCRMRGRLRDNSFLSTSSMRVKT